MKKSLSLILGLLVVLSLTLSACGGGAAPAEEAPAAEAPAAAEEAPAAEGTGELQPATEIVFYNWSEYIDPEIYAQFEDETGIKVIEDNLKAALPVTLSSFLPTTMSPL